jgi:hypothetical protein
VTDNEFFPDGSWADPLSREERRRLREKLADASWRFYYAARRYRVGADSRNTMYAASNELADLYLDVTERAKVATS